MKEKGKGRFGVLVTIPGKTAVCYWSETEVEQLRKLHHEASKLSGSGKVQKINKKK